MASITAEINVEWVGLSDDVARDLWCALFERSGNALTNHDPLSHSERELYEAITKALAIRAAIAYSFGRKAEPTDAESSAAGISSNHFSLRQLASMFNVTRETIERRALTMGLKYEYTDGGSKLYHIADIAALKTLEKEA